MKEQDLHKQRILQNLHQNGRYARFCITTSRFKHDIDAKYVGFCSKTLHWMVLTSRTCHFDAEKWLFCANAASIVDLGVKELNFSPYLYSQPAAGWGLA